MVFFWVLISPKNKNKIQITVHILDRTEFGYKAKPCPFRYERKQIGRETFQP